MSDIALSLSHIKRNNMTTAAPTRAQSTTNAACPVPPGAVAVGKIYISVLAFYTEYELPTNIREWRENGECKIYGQLAPNIFNIIQIPGNYEDKRYVISFFGSITPEQAYAEIEALIQYHCLAEGHEA